MDLLCCETAESECRAYPDPVLLNDDRVLLNLLRTEERYTPASLFGYVQHEVRPQMRNIVAEWMLEVCEEQKCQEEVFPLAMNYMDRFLGVTPIQKVQLQLLGTACLLLASKLREPEPLLAEMLVLYTDNGITLKELWRWELLVLSKLKWDLSAVTPQDFLRHYLKRLPVDDGSVDVTMVHRHAQTLIALCARDYKFSLDTPSMIAAASVAAALHGLNWTLKSGINLQDLLSRLAAIANIDQDRLQQCLREIDDMIAETINGVRSSQPDCSSSAASDGSQMTTTASASMMMTSAGNLPQHLLSDQHQQTQQHQQQLQLQLQQQLQQQQQQDATGTMSADSKLLLAHEKAGTPTDVRDVHF